ncbi:ABC superfamily ATP binding cassette transporter, ABC protein, partial [mine drainage metagenome]
EVLFLPPRPEDALLGADRRMEVEAALSLRGEARQLAKGRLASVERLLDLPPEQGDNQAERLYRALLGLVSQSPRALLLDEPTARVGPDARRWINRALLRLRAEGLVVVVATHDPELVRLADEVSIIADGHVLPGSLRQAIVDGILRAPELGRALDLA